jgi:hypothetical protein
MCKELFLEITRIVLNSFGFTSNTYPKYDDLMSENVLKAAYAVMPIKNQS